MLSPLAAAAEQLRPRLALVDYAPLADGGYLQPLAQVGVTDVDAGRLWEGSQKPEPSNKAWRTPRYGEPLGAGGIPLPVLNRAQQEIVVERCASVLDQVRAIYSPSRPGRRPR